MQMQIFYSVGKSPLCKELLNLSPIEGIIQLRKTKGANIIDIIKNTIYISFSAPTLLDFSFSKCITGTNNSHTAHTAVVKLNSKYQSIKLMQATRLLDERQ